MEGARRVRIRGGRGRGRGGEEVGGRGGGRGHGGEEARGRGRQGQGGEVRRRGQGGARGGRGGGRGRVRRVRNRITDDIRATIVDHVINHGMTLREAGQRVQPNLSSYTAASIIRTFRNENRTLSPTGHLLVAVSLGFIGTFGFVNNLLVLVLFCRYKVLRSPINFLLVNICLSDLLVCVLGTPFSFAASTQGRWLIGDSGCVWYGFANSLLGRGIDEGGEEKLDQDKGEEDVWERSKNVCWIVHLYGFPPYTCGTYESLFLP
ncbi:Melanopsin [Anabarilius grahami]|uniref:Melanopsin n=1 Tax=Anabarilius grahami TaxID=495550 RepID=A0A3N0Y0K4_ANAGA|nr:Melanopsin [Anabarilius grahami]